jgi:arylsulfatase A-like enzyme
LEDPSKTILKPAITSWGRGNYAVRSKDWRYIKYFDGTEELYSHKQDPNEWTNLAKNPELEPVKQKLRESLPNHESASVPNWALWSSVGADKEDSGFKILKRDWKKSAKRFNPPLPQKVQ